MEKKKSKQFETSTNGHMGNINLAQIDLHKQKKKKKKKKAKYEEMNLSISQQSSLDGEESRAKKKKKKREQEVEESPRKKKKSNKENEYFSLQTTGQDIDAMAGTQRSKKIKEENSEMETVEEDWWIPEERTAMLEAIKIQIPVTIRFSKQGYRSHLRKTNWDDVLSAVRSKTQGKPRTIKQCQDQFHNILHKVGTIKSLVQIVDEALSLATDPGALRREVTQARHRFIQDYMRRNKGDKKCSMMVATTVWTKLPAEEKDKWEEEYQNELRQRGLLDTKSTKSKSKTNGPDNSKAPYELYQKVRANKGEELSFAEAKLKYSSLSLKKKIPFIVESLKLKKVYETEAAIYLEKNPQWKKTKAHGPTIKEIKDYLETLGLPLAPPNTVIGMYFLEDKELFSEENKDDSIKVQNINESLRPYQRAREALHNLPKALQDKYKLEWRKSWIEYLSEVEKWKPMVEKNYPEILEEALAVLAEVKTPKNINEPSKKKVPEKKVPVRKNPVDPLSHIERHTSSLLNVKFENEPPLPARTAYELFQQKYKRDAGANYDQSKTKELWEKMSENKKAVYTERVNVLKQRSKNNFLSFARNLESQQRKLFVGVKRAKLLKYFQEDIFAVDYPGKDYPILIATPSKNSNIQVAKEKETVKEELIKEESDDDEDEESDEEEEAKEETEESSSDSESSSNSDSNSEVEASQPTPVSPFSQAKSGKNSSRLSHTANSSPFSNKLPSDASSDTESDSDEESDSEEDKENYKTPVSSRVQPKNNQRSGAATSKPAVKEEMTSDSESSSESSSDNEEDVTPAWKNVSSAVTPNPKGAGLVKKDLITDESSEEDSEESD